MIKANELRYGNLALVKYDRWSSSEDKSMPYERVILVGGAIGKDQDASIWEELEPHGQFWRESDLHPIPLTEEWMRKMGFKSYSEKGDSFAYWHIGDPEDEETGRLWSKGDIIHLEFPDVELQFVHQLQNLYFALTGEELTIKDDA